METCVEMSRLCSTRHDCNNAHERSSHSLFQRLLRPSNGLAGLAVTGTVGVMQMYIFYVCDADIYIYSKCVMQIYILYECDADIYTGL